MAVIEPMSNASPLRGVGFMVASGIIFAFTDALAKAFGGAGADR